MEVEVEVEVEVVEVEVEVEVDVEVEGGGGGEAAPAKAPSVVPSRQPALTCLIPSVVSLASGSVPIVSPRPFVCASVSVTNSLSVASMSVAGGSSAERQRSGEPEPKLERTTKGC